MSRPLSSMAGRVRSRLPLSLRRLWVYAATAAKTGALCATLGGYACATVTFSNPKSASTVATFSSTGTYVISCNVSDGVLNTKQSITIQVSSPIPALLSMDTPSGIGGNTVITNVTFSTGTVGVATLQFNLAIPSGVTISTSAIIAGSAATAAGKSVAGAVNSGVLTVIVSGLNQNVMPSGPIVSIPLSLGTALPTETVPLALSGIVASDPNAISAPINGQNGTLSVTANAAPTVTLSGPSAVVLPATASLSATASDIDASRPLTYQWSNP